MVALRKVVVGTVIIPRSLIFPVPSDPMNVLLPESLISLPPTVRSPAIVTLSLVSIVMVLPPSEALIIFPPT